MIIKRSFLPSDYNKGPIKEVIKSFVFINVGVLAVFSGIYVHNHMKDTTMNNDISTLTSQISNMTRTIQDKKVAIESDETYKEMTKLEDKVSKGEIKKTKDKVFNKFIEKLNLSINSNIKINDISFKEDEGGALDIKGQAIDYNDVEDFYKAMRDNGIFKEADIKSFTIVPENEGPNYAVKKVVEFEIEGVPTYVKSK